MEMSCRNLCKAFGDGRHQVQALEDVTFRIGHREVVSIVGPSGCGKSTLLRILAGLLAADSGTVAKVGEPANGRPANALVFQSHGLFPWMTIRENVAFGLRMAGARKQERLARAEELIERIGLSGFGSRYPHELSEGMRQRANLARAFVVDPELLLMDEPFAALDAQTRLVLQRELLEIFERSHKSVIYVTHDIEEAVLLGDRVLVMTGRPGRIREEIPVPLPHPRNLVSGDDPRVLSLRRRIWALLEDEVLKGLTGRA